MSSTFGKLWRVTTFGESHGGAVGGVIDGCPAGIAFDLDKIQSWLDRRRPGQSHISSPRGELDKIEVLSGLNEEFVSLGSPISFIVRNKDFRKDDYNDLETVFRPSHADYTTFKKYGLRASSGGGRSSARETIGRVASAAFAEQALQKMMPTFECTAWVETVKDISASLADKSSVTRDMVETNPVRCPDQATAKEMEKLILETQKKGDSVGGIIFFGIKNCDVGLGEPVFDKLEADLAKAMMSLPATKGFEIGSGFAGTSMYGSEHNDPFEIKDGKTKTTSNNSGGIQGGISNGELIYGRVGFKPVSTIFKTQTSVTDLGNETEFKPKKGRHDPCVLPRAVPMVEAMAILTIIDHFLRQRVHRALEREKIESI
ncbi:chorismate synthase [Oligoflexaceae bacterium]|nr:chorismate synthase [Oligoflexaceae bacterium]